MADASKLYMGLSNWKQAPDGKILKSDVSIAKNYLNEQLGPYTSYSQNSKTTVSYYPNENWKVSTPEEQGVGSEILLKMFESIQSASTLDFHSILIIRNGYLIFDLVVVFTANGFDDINLYAKFMRQFLEDNIYSAAISNVPLSAKPLILEKLNNTLNHYLSFCSSQTARTLRPSKKRMDIFSSVIFKFHISSNNQSKVKLFFNLLWLPEYFSSMTANGKLND